MDEWLDVLVGQWFGCMDHVSIAREARFFECFHCAQQEFAKRASSILRSKMCKYQIWCQNLSTDFLSKYMRTLNWKFRKYRVLIQNRLKEFYMQKGRLNSVESS